MSRAAAGVIVQAIGRLYGLDPVKDFITVCPNKKSSYILSYGKIDQFTSVHRSRSGKLVAIPNGFKIATQYQCTALIGEIKYHKGSPRYQFTEVCTIGVLGRCSGWCRTSSKALNRVLTKDGHIPTTYNGALVMGVTYPPVQKKLRSRYRVFHDEDEATGCVLEWLTEEE